MTPYQLQFTEDLLDAADREFENGNALAGTERLFAAVRETLTAIADAKGWPHDPGDLYEVVKKLAAHGPQTSDVLEGIYLAMRGHPGAVRAEYFRFEYGDTHRAPRMVREFIDTVRRLASESGDHLSARETTMLTQKHLSTSQDYLDAADREFENANALAAAKNLLQAAECSLIEIAEAKGWSYDRDNLDPVAEKLALANAEVGEILLTTYFAVGGYPDKVHFGYFVWEDGDSHRMLRVVREFVDMARQLAT